MDKAKLDSCEKQYVKTKVITYKRFSRMKEERQREIQAEINTFEGRMLQDIIVHGIVRPWHHFPPYYIKFH